MQSFSLNFLYLSPSVLTDPAWKHLGRFLHPGSRDKDQQALIVGRHLDVQWHPYLSIHALDWENTGTLKMLIRHDVVASILEVKNHTNQLGFVDLSAVREQLKDLQP